MRTNALAKVLVPEPPPDAIASLEAALTEATSNERDLSKQKAGLESRRAVLAKAAEPEKAALLELKREAAAGADVTDAIEARERTIRGLERQQEGIDSFLADLNGPLAAAGAEVSRLSRLLAATHAERERDSVAEQLETAEIESWELAAKLIARIVERDRLADLLCGDRFRQIGGPAAYTARIINRRDARKAAAIAENRESGRLDLINRILPS